MMRPTAHGSAGPRPLPRRVRRCGPRADAARYGPCARDGRAAPYSMSLSE